MAIADLLKRMTNMLEESTKDKPISKVRLETDEDLYNVLCRIDAGEVFSDEIMEKIGNWKEIDWEYGVFEFSKGNIPSSIGLVKSVTNLDLAGTKVSDIRVLSGLTALTNLDLAGTQVGDISTLSSLRTLTNLDLHATWVLDISALSGLTALTNREYPKDCVNLHTGVR